MQANLTLAQRTLARKRFCRKVANSFLLYRHIAILILGKLTIEYDPKILRQNLPTEPQSGHGMSRSVSLSGTNRVLEQVLTGLFIGHTQLHLIPHVKILQGFRRHHDLGACHLCL
jgi:hypothetical protein